MKQISFTGLLLACSMSGFAQSAPVADSTKPVVFKSKNGHDVLPKKGDCAIGISATGFLNYLGNMMNNNSLNNAPSITSANTPDAFGVGKLNGMALSAKYMKTATFAYRLRFQASAGSSVYKNSVMKSNLTPDPLSPAFVDDQATINSYVVLLGAGFEKRRGSGRLQGFYGAELLLGATGTGKKYAYGNNIDANFNAPVSTTDFASGATGNPNVRTTETKSGTTFLVGARSFVGVEYFFAPKMSLGGEIGYTLGFATTSRGTVKTEQWNGAAASVANITTDNYSNAGLTSFGIGLDNVNAGINLHFYF